MLGVWPSGNSYPPTVSLVLRASQAQPYPFNPVWAHGFWWDRSLFLSFLVLYNLPGRNVSVQKQSQVIALSVQVKPLVYSSGFQAVAGHDSFI